MISSGLGRYGPFLLHDGGYANLESIEDVFSIGLNRAVSVLADRATKNAAGGGRGRSATTALKELGDHPDGGSITVRDGRYGPYVNWGKINATLPKGKEPLSVSMEEALVLIAERAAKAPAGKTSRKPARAKSRRRAGAAKAVRAKTTKAKAAKPKTAAAKTTKTTAAAKAKKA